MSALEIEVLDRAVCLDLLRSAHVGRVGASVDALPVIFPVNYGMLGESVVFRTVPGTRFDAATAGAVVAFQVDEFGVHDSVSWSVLLQGVAGEVTEPDEVARVSVVPLPAWDTGHRAGRFLRLDRYQLSGRRFRGGT